MKVDLRIRVLVACGLAVILAASLPALLPAATSTANQSVTANFLFDCKISATSVTLTTSVTNFTGTYTSASPAVLTYSMRTSHTGGTGSITLQFFSAPTSMFNNLKYACASAGPGTACSGTLAVTTSATPVVSSIPAATNTNANTVNVSFSLADSASFAVGSYSTTILYTISAS